MAGYPVSPISGVTLRSTSEPAGPPVGGAGHQEHGEAGGYLYRGQSANQRHNAEFLFGRVKHFLR